jgi:hypothetical protein
MHLFGKIVIILLNHMNGRTIEHLTRETKRILPSAAVQRRVVKLVTQSDKRKCSLFIRRSSQPDSNSSDLMLALRVVVTIVIIKKVSCRNPSYREYNSNRNCSELITVQEILYICLLTFQFTIAHFCCFHCSEDVRTSQKVSIVSTIRW